ncbi:DUF3015 family protein [uncultured Salinisphaera sp.]|uniref:DUF3015 family protein n=1 Tax=uncultured Salinisphaera sp. TaxID=359372 RepID=UPI0032B1D024|tara:strand:- start:116 stop:565 length:450 start_codon:yes stop_codon:yes gene_type:complete
MRNLLGLGVVLGAGLAMTGCSQITVTSDTIVNGTAQIADATTNAVQQTSNGTTNASRSAFAQNHDARRKFVDSQYDMLKNEAARGHGEDLNALAYMMRADDKQAFAARIQQNYAALFDGQPTADAFLTRLYSVMGTPSDMRETSRVAQS